MQKIINLIFNLIFIPVAILHMLKPALFGAFFIAVIVLGVIFIYLFKLIRLANPYYFLGKITDAAIKNQEPEFEEENKPQNIIMANYEPPAEQETPSYDGVLAKITPAN
ncbi:hypothetical protein KS4_16050 [Poriferisphaera corsica]|uniref:Uncharacterized protein n=1 Tax=Poriferisphaera corsica TaxID=2528020 RepID=A0A517YTL0_9BACT|nr:hypothetical protein [Poriferisphaera corsica]QDU33554.1 hypothetical protein KS4_16050 [Poriferisphaera corsica]